MAPIRISPAMAMRTLKIARPAQRQFSVVARIRQAARDFEPHPFERYPTTQKAAPADWSRQFKKLGGNALFYFPGFAIILGWPLMGEAMLDGHVV
ncbi:hypothetical protein BDZ45DRAFT_676443 [Acephala macrosclerotiorum]|nr:hypothetical protein BDZ45DRAFT_676443 [Acephala macrosclerotiorum]